MDIIYLQFISCHLYILFYSVFVHCSLIHTDFSRPKTYFYQLTMHGSVSTFQLKTSDGHVWKQGCHPSPCMLSDLNCTFHLFPLSSTYTRQPHLSPFSSIKISASKMALPFFLGCVFCLWAVLCVSVNVAQEEDPELQRCKHQCEFHREASERRRRECEQKCEDYYREHQGPVVDPEKQLRQCLKQCELLEAGRQRDQCRQECLQRYEQKHLDEGRGKDEKYKQQQHLGEGGREDEDKDYPFVFRDQNFASFRTDRGEVKILEKFDQRSRLLRGLKNYRVICLEANPQTFVVPTHYDADIVGFVVRGISLLPSSVFTTIVLIVNF